MTVSTLTNRENQATAAATLIYVFNIQTADATTINTYFDSVINAGGFTVQLNVDQSSNPGGTVTFSVQPPVPATLTIERIELLTQGLDYQVGGPFPSESHEGGLDKLTRIVQQIDDSSVRSLRFPVSDSNATIIPKAADRANKYHAYDSNGDIVVLDATSAEPNAVQKPVSAVTAGNVMVFDAQKNALDSGITPAEIENSAVTTSNAYTDAQLLPAFTFMVGGLCSYV